MPKGTKLVLSVVLASSLLMGLARTACCGGDECR